MTGPDDDIFLLTTIGPTIQNSRYAPNSWPQPGNKLTSELPKTLLRGLEKKDAVMSEQKKKLVAYHEAYPKHQAVLQCCRASRIAG